MPINPGSGNEPPPPPTQPDPPPITREQFAAVLERVAVFDDCSPQIREAATALSAWSESLTAEQATSLGFATNIVT
jgi:hypothetical protein